MNTVNSAFQEVLFSYTFDALMTSIHAESAYVAVSVGSAVPSADKPLSAIIITDDEASFVRVALSKAHTAMLTRLSAYLANQPAADEDVYAIQLFLPERRKAEYDILIMKELQRAFVAYVLARWYEHKLPEVALQQQNIYEEAVANTMHNIFMLYGGMRRRDCYF